MLEVYWKYIYRLNLGEFIVLHFVVIFFRAKIRRKLSTRCLVKSMIEIRLILYCTDSPFMTILEIYLVKK